MEFQVEGALNFVRAANEDGSIEMFLEPSAGVLGGLNLQHAVHDKEEACNIFEGPMVDSLLDSWMGTCKGSDVVYRASNLDDDTFRYHLTDQCDAQSDFLANDLILGDDYSIALPGETHGTGETAIESLSMIWPSTKKEVAEIFAEVQNKENAAESSSASSVTVPYFSCRKDNAKVLKKKGRRAPARAWSQGEHQRFVESLELFGRNWERCASYIGTRRAQLVRSHAQKYLIKLWKLGKPLPKKVAESGKGYTLSGKPLHADSASARSYLTKLPCPTALNQSP